MKVEAAVKSTSMSDFLRSLTVDQKRAIYAAAAAKAMDSQKRVIEAAKIIQAH